MMYWNGDSNGWAWWAVAIAISMVALSALVLGAVWFAIRRTPVTPVAPGPRSAEETLRQRYAAGELDDEEFARRLQVLRGQPGSFAPDNHT